MKDQPPYHVHGYPFTPRYLETRTYRIHYIDEGPHHGRTVLLLHGIPTWSYLFRKMVPLLTGAGLRVVAPDLPGFGQSDKPTGKEQYSFDALGVCTGAFAEALDLRDMICFGHDWGGILAMRLAAEQGERIAALALCNGMVPADGQGLPFIFHAWKRFARYSPILPVGWLVHQFSGRALSPRERKAYDLPFKATGTRKGIRRIPGILPFRGHDLSTARKTWAAMERWEKPLLTLFSHDDPVTRGGDLILQKRVPGSSGQEHIRVEGNHFAPEVASDRIATAIIKLNRKL